MKSQKFSDSQEFIKNRKNPLVVAIRHWRRRWRSGLMRFTERILTGSNISDRLGGDLTQIRHLDSVNRQIEDLKVASPPVMTKKIDIDGMPLIQASMQRRVGKLRECAVEVHSGLIRLKSGFVLDGTLPHWQQLIYQGGFAHEYRALKKPKKRLGGEFLVVPRAKYFYHFIVEDLPSISWALEYYPECAILVSSSSPKWQLEVLETLGIKFQLTTHAALVVEKLIFVTAPRALTTPDINRIKALGNSSSSEKKSLKLYLARGNKDRGDLRLETELINYLMSKGFKVIDPDEVTFAEQKYYFENASKVISFHGGALTNIVWCRPGTKVLEIFNHAYRTYDYTKLSAEAGLDYYAVNFETLDSEQDLDLRSQIERLLPKVFKINE